MKEPNLLKIKVKEVFGKNYSPEISNHLIEKGLKNTLGKDYSFDSIRKIVEKRSNNEVLLAIVELIDTKIRTKKRLEKKIENIA